MRILIYKRTHTGDPDGSRRFGIEGCMGRVRGFAYDAVIGVGGVSAWPRRQGIAGKINWIGRSPRRSFNPRDVRGPLVCFSEKNFRLYEQNGPFLIDESPRLARKIAGSRARFFLNLTPPELKEAVRLIERALDLRQFDHLQVPGPALEEKRARCSGRVSSRACLARKRSKC